MSKVNHSFTHNKDPQGNIFVKLDDVILAFLKEASVNDDEASRNFMAGGAMFFTALKENIIKGEIEQIKFNERVEQEKKTWWGKLIWRDHKKNHR